MLPTEFREALFSAPVSARVMLNGKVLGDAMVMLSENDMVSILEFTDSHDSAYDESMRDAWKTRLSQPVRLGSCEDGCPSGLEAMHYSLENAQLSLVTGDAEGTAEDRWHRLPEQAGSGLMFHNQLNATAGQSQNATLSWDGEIQAGAAGWTGVARMQAFRGDGDTDGIARNVTALYAEKELKGRFVRGGLFTPDSRGVLRTPYLPGRGASTVTGIMTGSSDALKKDGASASLYPVYVTANRDSVVEIWRDGRLIDTQLVAAGLQPVDTTRLPRGVYEVELRVREDGREVSRISETIHKPMSWADPSSRFQYNLYVGQEQSILSSPGQENEGRLATGASASYLLHSTLVGSAAASKFGRESQTGLSLDWQAGGQTRLYAGAYHSNLTGTGFDTQAVFTGGSSSLTASHGRSWQPAEKQRDGNHTRSGNNQRSSLSYSYRFRSADSIAARVSHTNLNGGMGYDLSYSTRTDIGETRVNWQLSAFDRPYQDRGESRNRGVALTASFSFGEQTRRASASLGTRNDSAGQRELYASASVGQTWQKGPVKETTLTVTADRHGAGLSAWNSLDIGHADGTFWGQSSAGTGKLSGGINLNSTIVAGAGGATVSSARNVEQAGVIVDVHADDPTVTLVARHGSGSHTLKAGRNFVPVEAWKPGSMEYDFAGTDDPGMKVWPDKAAYHLARGSVAHQEVRVMKTVTVMGRLTDVSGQPLAGARVVNHAGRSVSEHDGIFTLTLHERNPVIQVEPRNGGAGCEMRIPVDKKQAGEVIFAGDIVCQAG